MTPRTPPPPPPPPRSRNSARSRNSPVVAGIDIGNSTTEVVLARLGPTGIEVIGAGRAPTRRAKGSPESLDGAAALVRRLERRHGVRIDAAAAAMLRPVETRTASLPEPEQATGRLRLVTAAAGTAGGRGTGVGRPHLLQLDDDHALPGHDSPVVAVVPAGMGYRAAVEKLSVLQKAGRLTAVLLEDDEAVLVANRLGGDLPIVDEIDAAAALGADLLIVEVAGPGGVLRDVGDPLRLVDRLGLAEEERADAARLAAQALDATSAVVALDQEPTKRAPQAQGWVELDGAGRTPFAAAHAAVAGGPVGLARAYALPPKDEAQSVDDLWIIDLASVAAGVIARSAGTRSRAVGLAALRSDLSFTDPAGSLTELLEVPVTVTSEARAARIGGLSTPGAAADGVVLDLGGGTIDAVSARSAVVAAGCGDLLTACVAALSGCGAAAAEWVKRGPAFRVEAPLVMLSEDGGRSFSERSAPAETIGALVVHGPAGLLPFSRVLAPGEWRALRLRLKVDLVGGNVSRALRTLGETPRTVVVVGGAAGDDEVVSALTRALPAGVAVGRGDVAGSLGHRYAVAYGLLPAAIGSDAGHAPRPDAP